MPSRVARRSMLEFVAIAVPPKPPSGSGRIDGAYRLDGADAISVPPAGLPCTPFPLAHGYLLTPR